MTDQASTIPNGWKMTTLGKVAEIIGGGTPKTDIAEYWNGDIPWLSVADFNDESRWVYKTEKHITEKGLESSAAKLLNTGDLIISARGTVGAFAQLKSPMAFNQSCYGLRAKENSENNFLYYLLKQNNQQLKKNVHGAVFDTITRDTFDQIEIGLPSLPEQHAIAAMLSSLDNKIELLREQNKTLEVTAQAIFKKWFATPSEALAKEDKLPKGWRAGKIKDLINIFSGFAFSSSDFMSNGKYKLVTIKNVQDRYFNPETKDYLADIPQGMQDFCNIRTGDILLSLTGNVGRICLVVGDDYLLNQRVAKLKPINVKDYAFSYLTFLQESIFFLLQNIASGTAQQNLSPIQTKEIEIIIPPRGILDAFGKLANPMIQKINFNNSQIQTLSKLCDTLLPKLMKGEVRVKSFK